MSYPSIENCLNGPFIEKCKKTMSDRTITIYFVITLIVYFIISIYSVSQIGISSFKNLISLLILLPISNAITSAILISLILISVCLYYGWMGYDIKSKMYGVNFALFLYVGFAFLISGVIMLDSAESNIASLSVNNETSILNSGIFGNSIGTVGLALALISIGLASYDKIQMNKTEEEILLRLQKKEYLLKKYKTSLSRDQINLLGLFWIVIGTLIGLILSFTITVLPFITSLSLMVSILWIGPVGLMLVIYAYYLSKKPLTEPESYTFEELIQKINDNSRLKTDYDKE
jgi:hypothetical protein